jgi:hypothetical protein
VKVPNLDIDLLALSYVSATPVLGGQLAVGMMGFWGRNTTTLYDTSNIIRGFAANFPRLCQGLRFITQPRLLGALLWP